MHDCCGRFATWVTVVTTPNASNDRGMTISAFMQAYPAPQLVAVCVGRQSVFLEKARGAGPYLVSISDKEMDAHALHFAGRFDESFTDFFAEHGALPALCDACAVLVTDLR
ncbi:flavin reductase [Asaia spathodeae]|uniref:flavin reductase n=1 Tax=Asaia spathodeae TaxID=657016 RepID=UPI002FC2BE04